MSCESRCASSNSPRSRVGNSRPNSHAGCIAIPSRLEGVRRYGTVTVACHPSQSRSRLDLLTKRLPTARKISNRQPPPSSVGHRRSTEKETIAQRSQVSGTNIRTVAGEGDKTNKYITGFESPKMRSIFLQAILSFRSVDCGKVEENSRVGRFDRWEDEGRGKIELPHPPTLPRANEALEASEPLYWKESLRNLPTQCRSRKGLQTRSPMRLNFTPSKFARDRECLTWRIC